jgi:hypothetical protein
MDQNIIDQQGLHELAFLAIEHVDSSFNIWMSGTFAVIVVAHIVGPRLRRRAIYVIAILYAGFCGLYALRIGYSGSMANQYITEITALQPEVNSGITVLRPFVFVLGTISALYFLLKPEGEINK